MTIQSAQTFPSYSSAHTVIDNQTAQNPQLNPLSTEQKSQVDMATRDESNQDDNQAVQYAHSNYAPENPLIKDLFQNDQMIAAEVLQALQRQGVSNRAIDQFTQNIGRLPGQEKKQFLSQLKALSNTPNLADKALFLHVAKNFANPFSIEQSTGNTCFPAASEFILLKHFPSQYTSMMQNWNSQGTTQLTKQTSVIKQTQSNIPVPQQIKNMFQLSMFETFAQKNPQAGMTEDWISNGRIWSEPRKMLESLFPGRVQSLTAKVAFANEAKELNALLEKGKKVILLKGEHTYVITGKEVTRGTTFYTYFDPATSKGHEIESPLAALQDEATSLLIIS